MSYTFYSENGKVLMSTEPDLTVLPDIIMSLSVKKGTWFLLPWFGHRLHTITKMTSDAPSLVQSYVKEALQWLLDAGRISSLAVSVQVSAGNVDRIDYSVRAVQADGQMITWSNFKEVI